MASCLIYWINNVAGSCARRRITAAVLAHSDTQMLGKNDAASRAKTELENAMIIGYRSAHPSKKVAWYSQSNCNTKENGEFEFIVSSPGKHSNEVLANAFRSETANIGEDKRYEVRPEEGVGNEYNIESCRKRPTWCNLHQDCSVRFVPALFLVM